MISLAYEGRLLLTDRLHDHNVNLVRAELDLVTGQRVRETQSHSVQVTVRQVLRDEVVELKADAAHQLHNTIVVDGFDAQFLANNSLQFRVSDSQFLAKLLLCNSLLQEFFQALAQLAFVDRGSRCQSISGILEFLESLQRHANYVLRIIKQVLYLNK